MNENYWSSRWSKDQIKTMLIEQFDSFWELAFYLLSNPSGLVSFNKLKDQFRLGSVNTIKSYIDYMENSWLVFTLNLFDFSAKRQQIAPKKVYCIDTGLSNALGFGLSTNTGKLLENQVFLALRRQTKEIYYYATPGGYERNSPSSRLGVDFYFPEKRQLIQVTTNLENPATREREDRALSDALNGLKVESALILSDANQNSFEISGVPVHIRSAADWLLS